MKGGDGKRVRRREHLSKRKAGDFHCPSEYRVTTCDAQFCIDTSFKV